MLVASFRIAARVANTAWKYIQAKQALAAQPDGSSSYDMYRAQSELQEALHEYSPENWPPPKPTAHDVLVGVYDECAVAPTREEILEILYRAIERTQG